jgi:hypothetical protein
MDEDLKLYLESMKSDLVGRIDRSHSDLVGRIDRAAVATGADIGSLHTQIQQTEERLGAKIEELHTRLDNHAGMLQSGSRQLTRFFQFSERQASTGRL